MCKILHGNSIGFFVISYHFLHRHTTDDAESSQSIRQVWLISLRLPNTCGAEHLDNSALKSAYVILLPHSHF